jgi:hypothetical protein
MAIAAIIIGVIIVVVLAIIYSRADRQQPLLLPDGNEKDVMDVYLDKTYKSYRHP